MRRTVIFWVAFIVLDSLFGGPDLGTTYAASMARSSANQDGVVLTVTVPIQLRGLGGRTWRNPQTGERLSPAEMAAVIEQRVENLWNDGLAQWRYRGCYRLRVDLQVTALPAGGSFSSGNHPIDLTTNLSHRSFVRTRRPERHADTDIPYTRSVAGKWSAGGVRLFAHETGHLMGLADDYDDVKGEDGKSRSVPLPGREGTLMADGTTIDQALANRLGDIVAKMKDLPGCIYASFELWNEASIDRPNEIALAQGSAFVEMYLMDDGQGVLTGEGTYTANFFHEMTFFHGSTCHIVDEFYSEPEVQTFEAVGKRDGDTITIQIPADELVTRANHVSTGACEGSLQLAVQPVIPPRIGGVLVDGKFEFNSPISWTPAWDTGGAGTVLVIEERDVEQ